jgi:hypothetical protein
MAVAALNHLLDVVLNDAHADQPPNGFFCPSNHGFEVLTHRFEERMGVASPALACIGVPVGWPG